MTSPLENQLYTNSRLVEGSHDDKRMRLTGDAEIDDQLTLLFNAAVAHSPQPFKIQVLESWLTVDPEKLKAWPYFANIQSNESLRVPPFIKDVDVIKTALDFLQGERLPVDQTRSFYFGAYILGHHFHSQTLQKAALAYCTLDQSDLRFANECYKPLIPDIIRDLPTDRRLDILIHFPHILIEQINQDNDPSLTLGEILSQYPLDRFGDAAPLIQRADLTHFRAGQITDVLEQLAQKCSIKHLCLPPSTDDNSFATITAFSMLEHLDLSQCENLSPHAFNLIPRHLKGLSIEGRSYRDLGVLKELITLENLNMGYCPNLHPDVFDSLPPSLLSLNLSGNRLPNPTEALYRCPNLQHLYICHYNQPVDLSFLAYTKELRSLHLTGAPLLSPVSLLHLRFVPHLEQLYLQNGTLESNPLRHLESYTPKLKSLTIQDQNLAPNAFEHLQSLSRLEELKIIVSADRIKIIDKQDLAVLSTLPSLKTLHLEGYEHLQDGDFIHLSNCLSLQELQLIRCKRRDRKPLNLRHLIGCEKLTTLTLSELDEIQPSSLVDLPKSLLNLTIEDSYIGAPNFLDSVKLPRLRSLTLRHVADNLNLQNITATHFPLLNKLALDTPRGDVGFLTRFKHLHSLTCYVPRARIVAAIPEHIKIQNISYVC